MLKTRLWITIIAVVIAVFALNMINVQGVSKEQIMSTESARATKDATSAIVQPSAAELAANKKLVEQVVDVLNTGNYDVLNKIVAENYVQHGAGRPSTRKGLQATYAAYRAAFPDIKWTIEFIGADGDKVFLYSTLTGTQKAPFNGIPATNNVVSINTSDVYQITDGLIVAHWDVFDQFGLLTQLGILPRQGK